MCFIQKLGYCLNYWLLITPFSNNSIHYILRRNFVKTSYTKYSIKFMIRRRFNLISNIGWLTLCRCYKSPSSYFFIFAKILPNVCYGNSPGNNRILSSHFNNKIWMAYFKIYKIHLFSHFYYSLCKRVCSRRAFTWPNFCFPT